MAFNSALRPSNLFRGAGGSMGTMNSRLDEVTVPDTWRGSQNSDLRQASAAMIPARQPAKTVQADQDGASLMTNTTIVVATAPPLQRTRSQAGLVSSCLETVLRFMSAPHELAPKAAPPSLSISLVRCCDKSH